MPLSIPADLTAARIRRANPSIDAETARQDAAELHDIIACVRQAYAAHPKPYPEFDVDDLVGTIMRAALDRWPENEDAAADESVWLALQFIDVERLTGVDTLYVDYLRVCGHVAQFDYITYCGLDGDDEDGLSAGGVTFEDEAAEMRSSYRRHGH